MSSGLKSVLGLTVIFLLGVGVSTYHSQRTATADHSDEWKSYLNDQYGLGLKYPKDWFVQEDSPEVIGFCPTRGGLRCQQREGTFSANILIKIHENPKELKIREYLFIERYGNLPKDLAELTIDGYQAIRLGPEGTSQVIVYVAKDNYVYELQAHDFTNIFGKIIKTVKFHKR
jgi:hypothetical protein